MSGRICTGLIGHCNLRDSATKPDTLAAGMRFLLRHWLTAGEVMPRYRAIAPGPPRQMMISCAFMSEDHTPAGKRCFLATKAKSLKNNGEQC